MSEGGPSPTGDAPQAVTLVVEVVRHGDAWNDGPISDDTVALAAQAAFTEALPKGPAAYEATIVLTDDAEMRELNRTWRSKDAPTNVLSFPAAGPVIEPDIGPDAEGETRSLGDIVLARETVMREAVEQAVDFSHHVTHLIVHGVLHLLGYDHGVDAEAEEMEALEIEILSELGIDNPYTEEPVGSV